MRYQASRALPAVGPFKVQRSFHRQLGIRLAKLREMHQFSQSEIARLLGVSQQTVFSAELGDRRVPLDRLLKYAEIFRLTSLDQLIGLRPLPPERFKQISRVELSHLKTLRALQHRDKNTVRRIASALAAGKSLDVY